MPTLPNDDFISVHETPMIGTSIVEKVRMGQYKRQAHNQLQNETVDRNGIIPTQSNDNVTEEELYHRNEIKFIQLQSEIVDKCVTIPAHRRTMI